MDYIDRHFGGSPRPCLGPRHHLIAMTGAIKLAATAVSMALAFAPHVLARTVTSASAVTQAFVAQEAAPLDGSLTYTVALTPGDQAGLDARMLNTSLHGGEWLSEAELAKFLRPKDEHVAAVKAHLTTHGVNESDISTSKLGDALRVKSTIAAANAAWNTTLSTYAHATEGHKIVRASGGYTIPDGILHEAIQNVHPFTSFPNVRGSHPVAPARDVAVADSDAKSAKCNASAVTPQCLKHHYGAANFTPKPQKGENDVLVFGFLGQYASQKDLTKFMKKYSDYPDYSIDIINAGNSTNDPSNPGSEAMLDVCMVGGLAAPLNSQFLSFGAAGVENEPFQQAFDWILEKYDDKSRPGVITASYVDDESSYSASDAQYLCHTIQKVSALGTTVLYGSGDNGLNGVQSFENLKCKSHFNPTTPGDCPYVLSVGGTQGFPEVVVNGSSPEGFFAGAGFSNHFERPSYQVRGNIISLSLTTSHCRRVIRCA